jgi:hypothetical protein
MADGVDASVDAMQAIGAHAALDHRVAKADRAQLLQVTPPALLGSDLGERQIRGVLAFPRYVSGFRAHPSGMPRNRSPGHTDRRRRIEGCHRPPFPLTRPP